MHQNRDGVSCGGPNNRPLAEMTREELLWDLRTFAEESHRIFLWQHGIRETYKPSFRDADGNCLPSMSVHDVADTCNKSVPVYIIPGPRWRLLRVVLHNYIYRRWFRPYRSEVEFQRFICKFIIPRDLPEESPVSPPRSHSIIKLNRVICDEVEAQRSLYVKHRKLGHDCLPNRSIIPNERLRILQPLFRALLIVVSEEKYNNEDSKTVGRLPVHLVRTGVEEGLSAPITFDPIVAKIINHIEPGRIVQVTIETAIDFVMSLEARESAAFGLRPDPVTEWQPDVSWDLKFWREHGETGPLIGPSSRWVDVEKYPVWAGNGQKADAEFMAGIEQREFRYEARREAREAQRAADKRE